jgi:hypothetical protein
VERKARLARIQVTDLGRIETWKGAVRGVMKDKNASRFLGAHPRSFRLHSEQILELHSPIVHQTVGALHLCITRQRGRQ